MHLEPDQGRTDEAESRKEVKAQIPVDTRERLGELKEETGKTFTDAVTEALELYFDNWDNGSAGKNT